MATVAVGREDFSVGSVWLAGQALLTPLFLEMHALALLNMEYGSVGQVNFGYLEAGAVIAMVPCVLLYVGLQRFYIRGLVSGVVKG